jgi:hypothetical protein
MDEYIFDDDISNTPESSIVSNQKGRYECIWRNEALADAWFWGLACQLRILIILNVQEQLRRVKFKDALGYLL